MNQANEDILILIQLTFSLLIVNSLVVIIRVR